MWHPTTWQGLLLAFAVSCVVIVAAHEAFLRILFGHGLLYERPYDRAIRERQERAEKEREGWDNVLRDLREEMPGVRIVRRSEF